MFIYYCWFIHFNVWFQRKRNLDMRCVLFPDDVKDTFKKAGKASARTSTPATKSWERCGDSFLDTALIQVLH